MPRIRPAFEIGDAVHHQKYGNGFILGKGHTRFCNDIPLQFYHTVFLRKSQTMPITFGYYSTMELIEPATVSSVELVKNILTEAMMPKHYGKFAVGDKVIHSKFGQGIVLGNAVKKGKTFYYHIYYPDTNEYGYNSKFSLLSKKNALTKNIAKSLTAKIMGSVFTRLEQLQNISTERR